MAQTSTATKPLQQNATKKQRAAILLADDAKDEYEIADEVGVNRVTLWRWQQEPEFNAMVGDYRGQIIADALRLPIAKKHERLKVLNDLHSRSLRVIAERAARYAAELGADSPERATRRFFGSDTPPEAATGIMARQEAMNPKGQLTVNWSVDTGLLKEIRETEKQAAQELGQWVDKGEISGPGGTPLTVLFTERPDGPE